jgi:hypothetical protein
MKSRGVRIRGGITLWLVKFQGFLSQAFKERLTEPKKLESQIK